MNNAKIQKKRVGINLELEYRMDLPRSLIHLCKGWPVEARVRSSVLASGDSELLTPIHRNLHNFKAVEDSILIDIVFHSEENKERYNFFFEEEEGDEIK